MEKRDLNIAFYKSGSGSISTRITLPKKWIEKNKKLKKKNRKLKSEVNRYKDLIEHRKEVSIINYNLYSDLECERDELLAEVEELKATISKMETITEKVFDETISRWHDSDVENVYEYLGITEDEYKKLGEVE